MPEPLIHLGVIILILCVLVSALESMNSGRKRERDIRQRLLIEQWKREHPYL
jgi:hypothetical protein